MGGEADRLDRRQRGGLGIERHGVRPGDAEFVAGPAGGDFVVRSGVDIRVDPRRHPRGPAHRCGDGGQHAQFLGAFDVDLADVLGQREAKFPLGLADAGIHDPAGRNAGGAGPAKFALADHVGAGALAAEQRQDGEVVVGLHRVMRLRIEAGVAQRLGQRAIAAAQRAGGIDPGRRADGIGDRG